MGTALGGSGSTPGVGSRAVSCSSHALPSDAGRYLCNFLILYINCVKTGVETGNQVEINLDFPTSLPSDWGKVFLFLFALAASGGLSYSVMRDAPLHEDRTRFVNHRVRGLLIIRRQDAVQREDRTRCSSQHHMPKPVKNEQDDQRGQGCRRWGGEGGYA